MDCSPSGSSVHGIFQATVLEWVAISSSRGTAQPKDRTDISCSGRPILYSWATRETQEGLREPTIPWLCFLAEETEALRDEMTAQAHNPGVQDSGLCTLGWVQPLRDGTNGGLAWKAGVRSGRIWCFLPAHSRSSPLPLCCAAPARPPHRTE